ncbi:hypothetical protein [Nereida sp. MMG025]|uniref:hypothetical protein n=1 Tax=Nereida sp. MMG025 TaxID=2909981 RepID=UPI001F487BDB|nr:hypothetical protein [Nereida sp. MMG025]MCF6445031.1 hypothetical protein [Nereida sp. MMG025]
MPLPPALKTPPEHRYAMRPIYYLSAMLITWLGVPIVALAVFYACMFVLDFLGLDAVIPDMLEAAISVLLTPLILIGFSFVVSWAPVLLGSVAMVFALKNGTAGWAVALGFGCIMGAIVFILMDGQNPVTPENLMAFAAITAIGGVMGLVYWITCYRLAPAAFKKS